MCLCIHVLFLNRIAMEKDAGYGVFFFGSVTWVAATLHSCALSGCTVLGMPVFRAHNGSLPVHDKCN